MMGSLSMDDYHYTFMDTDGRTGADLTLHPSSDEVACELAKELLSKSKFASLELRKGPGADLIYRIGKTHVEGPHIGEVGVLRKYGRRGASTASKR
jgi:hypothetical protein